MKRNVSNGLLILSLFCSTTLVGQSLSVKTNELLLNFKNDDPIATGPLPKIHWVYPLLDFSSSEQNEITVEASVESFTALREVTVYANSAVDSLSLGSKSLIIQPDLRHYEIKQKLILPDGQHVVSVQVVTQSGAIISDKRTVLVGKNTDNNLLAMDRKDYVLLFATDKYDHWDDLVNPIDDAHAIAKELKEKYDFEVELVENPRVEEIWEKLRSYNERNFKPQDQLLIFFAGHGYYDEAFGEGFVVAKNSMQKDLSRTTYLSHNRLRGVVNNIPCKHILLTMDVCFGGTLDPIVARSRGSSINEVSENEMIARKLRYRARKYLTSGGKEYVSDGVAGRHSPFAERFIVALQTLGGEDRVLTLSELQSNLEKLKQLPRFGSFGEDESLSDFVFVGKRNE